jgi:sporulation protein YlmC with PRC-barrel domain
MIKKLMAGSALVALMSAGAINIATAQDNVAKPAAEQTVQAADSEKKLVPDTPTLATAFIGRSVYSSEDPESASIGDVNDLIIADDGSITNAVVGVGGFLGIGEKNVAVPFDELQVVERDGEIRLIYAATREQLEAAPAVDLASYDPAARYAEEQAALNASQQPAGALDSPLAPVPAPMAGTDNMAAAPADATAPAADVAAAPAPVEDLTAQPADQAATDAIGADAGFITAATGQIRASTLMGKAVYGPDDQSIGEVSDLVLEKEGGTRAALVDVGGFLGVGEKTVAIRFGDMQFTQADAAADQKITIAMTKEQLEALPTYEPTDTASQVSDQAAERMAANPPATATDPAVPVDPDRPVDQTGQMAANTDQMTTGAIGTTPETTIVAQEVAASDLMGARVYGSDDSDLGEVSDIVFAENGDINAVVVDVGGFLGVGEKPVALEFNKLDVRVDQGGSLIVSVNTTKDQLDQAPTYEVSMQ